MDCTRDITVSIQMITWYSEALSNFQIFEDEHTCNRISCHIMLQSYLSVLVNSVLFTIAVQKFCHKAAFSYKPQCTNHIFRVFIFDTHQNHIGM
jgi:hypothetical protein